MKLKTSAKLVLIALLLYFPTQYLMAFSLGGWPTFDASAPQTGTNTAQTGGNISGYKGTTSSNNDSADDTANPTETSANSPAAASTTSADAATYAAGDALLKGHPYDNYKNDNLDPNENTPKEYQQIKFDPFNNKYRQQYDYKEVLGGITDELDTPPQADFNLQSSSKGLSDYYSGTTSTTFTFNGTPSDSETSSGRLEVRWDYESDGKWDSFFSYVKSVTHRFEAAGVYKVTMQVLDKGGNVASITKKVTVVENTVPSAYFTFKPVTGTSATYNAGFDTETGSLAGTDTGTVFAFDTSRSSDDQYDKTVLRYRFDWESDGKWDTLYNAKTQWKHKFPTSGSHNVTMEVADPEGATATAYATITTFENTPPTALMSVSLNSNMSKANNYTAGPNFKVYYSFDASSSTDTETPANKLKYRWDFNYSGKDDIVFDTGWSNSPRYNGYYGVPGEKGIRLQVMDGDGAISEAYARITVSENTAV